MAKSLHSICRWTFNAGKGGFVPADIRPDWAGGRFGTPEMIQLVADEIRPRLPRNVVLGIELHYDAEVDDNNAAEVADALVDNKLYLAMITPGAHTHFAYGGIASLDKNERKAAEGLGTRTVDLAYGTLRKAWHPDVAPAFVIWNGSFGYDVATDRHQADVPEPQGERRRPVQVRGEKGRQAPHRLRAQAQRGTPGHADPDRRQRHRVLAQGRGGVRRLRRKNKGVNKEFGHSEMIGLDHVYDTVEELDNDMLVHMHLNSQGYNDGIILGGPGKYDIDHGARINGMNIAIAGLIQQAGYDRWKGHDMQARPYDNAEQAIDRVIRSVLSWEACEKAAKELKTRELLKVLAQRDTAAAEDMMRAAVVDAQKYFDQMYAG